MKDAHIGMIAGLVILALFMSTAYLADIAKSLGSQQQSTGVVYGKVSLLEGNCMPSIDPKVSSCKSSYVSRVIYIRELASSGNMDPQDITYLQNETRLVATVRSDSNGFYQLSLPTGVYSVFAEDGGREYCNSFGGQGEVCSITILAGTSVKHDIIIDHATH